MIAAAGRPDDVSEDGIRQLVDAFYVKVRADPELAPIFAHAIPGDWKPHLTKMYAFWSSVMLTTGRYKGNPVAKHLVIPGMKRPAASCSTTRPAKPSVSRPNASPRA